MTRRFLCLLAIAAAGCGKPTLYPAEGEVRIVNKPAANVRVFFWAESAGDSPPSTRIGTASTDAEGRFKIICSSGEEGLERGSYRVTFSRPVVRGKTFDLSGRPDGAVESVPMPYSDHKTPANSPIVASVPSTTLVLEIPMTP